MRFKHDLLFITLLALIDVVSAMQFDITFATSIFNGVEGLLTVPWYQGIESIVTAFGSKWDVLADGSTDSVHFNNTFSYLWSLYKPFHERTNKLDFLYIGFRNGAMMGYALSTNKYDVPAEAWWQPNRNSTCNFTYGGIRYDLAPDYTIPWRKRTKAQSGCVRIYDGNTDPDSGHFSSATYAFNYDPTVRPWYIQSRTSGDGWTDPYVFAANGAVGITAVAPLYNTDDSILLGAAAADYELGTIDKFLGASVVGSEDKIVIYIVDREGIMISASVKGVAVVNNERQYANMTNNSVIRASANQLKQKYSSWTNASKQLFVVSVPNGFGLFWAMSRELKDSHGLIWHVVVAERIDCNPGFYQFDDGTRQICRKCPTGKQCDGFNSLPYPKRGYWDSLPRLEHLNGRMKILPATQCKAEGNCPSSKELKACHSSVENMKKCIQRAEEGGDEFGSAVVCAPGSRGRLCDICEESYFYAHGRGCLQCGGAKSVTSTIVVFVTFVAALIGACILVVFSESLFGVDVRQLPLWKACTEMARLKIIWATCQIVAVIEFTTNVTWPEPFASLARVMSLTQLNLPDMIPIGCAISNITFIHQLLSATLVPISIVVLLNVASLPQISLLARGDAIKWSQMVAFCVLPSTSFTLFRMFDCKKFPGGTSWLTAQVDLSCKSPIYHAFLAYTAIFLLVYPIGIPLSFYFSLRRKKAEIVELDRKEPCPAKLKKYEFLYVDYKNEYWHGEAYRSMMRVMLTGAVIIVSGSETVRAFCSVILSLCWVLCDREYPAYLKLSDNVLATTAQYYVFFASLLAFLLVDKSFNLNESAMAWLLVVATLVVLILAVRRGVRDEKERRRLSTHEVALLEAATTAQMLQTHIIDHEDIRLEEKIGASEYGEMFRGAAFGQPVSINVLVEVTKESLKSFRDAILLGTGLRHPNILALTGACWSRELVCVVHEWMPRGSLRDMLDDKAVDLEWAQVLLRIVTDIARGMHNLHDHEWHDANDGCLKRGVMHQALRLDKVLLNEFLVAKVYGFSSSHGTRHSTEVAETSLCTAPEIVLGHNYDEKVDVYSFGLLMLDVALEEDLFDFICNRYTRAFGKANVQCKTPTVAALSIAMARDGWRPFDLGENTITFVPTTIMDLISRCCHPDPIERPNFSEIVEGLKGPCNEEITAAAANGRAHRRHKPISHVCKKIFGAYMSFHPGECGSQAKIMNEALAAMLGDESPVCYQASDTSTVNGQNWSFDSTENTLNAIRERVDKVKASDTLIILQTKSVLWHPIVLFELDAAIANNIPIIPVNVSDCDAAYDFEAALTCLSNFDAALASASAKASELLNAAPWVSKDLGKRLMAYLPNLISVDFRPSQGHNAINGTVLDILEKIQCAAPTPAAMAVVNDALQASQTRARRRSSFNNTGITVSLPYTGRGKRFAAFLSHYKLQCGPAARLVDLELYRLLGDDSENFLDSDDLGDLRQLQSHIKNSDVLVLMQTQGVLTRPWCIAELYTAFTTEVPVICLRVHQNEHPFDENWNKEYLENFASRVDGVNPDILPLLRVLKMDPKEVGEVLLRGIFHQEMLKSDFHPNGTMNQIWSQMLDLKENMEKACRRSAVENMQRVMDRLPPHHTASFSTSPAFESVKIKGTISARLFEKISELPQDDGTFYI